MVYARNVRSHKTNGMDFLLKTFLFCLKSIFLCIPFMHKGKDEEKPFNDFFGRFIRDLKSIPLLKGMHGCCISSHANSRLCFNFINQVIKLALGRCVKTNTFVYFYLIA